MTPLEFNLQDLKVRRISAPSLLKIEWLMRNSITLALLSSHVRAYDEDSSKIRK